MEKTSRVMITYDHDSKKMMTMVQGNREGLEAIASSLLETMLDRGIMSESDVAFAAAHACAKHACKPGTATK